ncbi:retrovirus-related pol polyprotein from transposon TNT 1-94 [Tanacetum coccineum]
MMTASPLVDSGFAIPVFSPGDDPIACLNKAMAFLTAVSSLRFPSTNNQLKTSLNPRNQATIQDGRVTVQQVHGRQGQSYYGTGYKSNATSSGGNNASGQARVVKCYNCQGEGHMARQISDEEQLTFLADPRVLNGQAIQTIIPNNAAFQTEDLDTCDSDCDDISNAKAVLMANISNYGYDVISEIKPTLYDGIVISAKHVDMPVVDDEETLILENKSRSKMSKKEKDPKAIKQNISHKPIDYEKLNRLSDDFGKRFTTQQELSAEQAFWLCMSNPTSKPFDASPVKIKAPKELPKVSLVNESLKKLKFHLARFDNVVKIRTTPDARTEGEWGFEHTKAIFNNEIIPFLKSLKDIFNVFDKDLLNEIMEVFKEQVDSIKKTRVRTKEQSDSLIDKLNLKSAENEDLKAQIQDKVIVITSLKNDLRKVKGKEIVDIVAQIPSANTIVPGMFKLDLEPLAPMLLQNREAHTDYLKYTREQADILWEK